MAILYYQLFIFASLVLMRLFASKYLIHIAIVWTLFTAANVFFPPLIFVQLCVIWVTYFVVGGGSKSSKPVVNARSAFASADLIEQNILGEKSESNSTKKDATGSHSGKATQGGFVTVLEGISTATKIASSNLEKMNDGLERFNRQLDENASVRKLNAESRALFAGERSSVNFCLEHARELTAQEMRFKDDPKLKKIFDDIATNWGDEDERKKVDQKSQALLQASKPLIHENVDVLQKSQVEYSTLVSNHKEFLAEIFSVLSREEEIIDNFAKLLGDFGRNSLASHFRQLILISDEKCDKSDDSGICNIYPSITINLDGAGEPNGTGLIADNNGTISGVVGIEKSDISDVLEGPFDELVQAEPSVKDLVCLRDIPYLVHFTRVENLDSILSFGLISIKEARAEGLSPIISDPNRWDDRLDRTSLSISFPNYKMFWKRRMEAPDQDWVILKLKPSILWEYDCLYCAHNGADRRIRRCSDEKLRAVDAFEGMFSEGLNNVNRSAAGLKSFYPTDPQAEVLVRGRIAPENIMEVVFSSAEVRGEYSAFLRHYKSAINSKGRGLFAVRNTHYAMLESS